MPRSALPRELAAVLALKAALLAVIWLAFVRGNAIAVDAHGVAEAFGLANATVPIDSHYPGVGHGH